MWLPNKHRFPTDKELEVINQLRHDLSTSFEDHVHQRLLRRLWEAVNPPDKTFCKENEIEYQPYERYSTSWLKLGFQRDDPAIDFRAGGKLALECMVYFVEIYRLKALQTMVSHKCSWAIACVNVVRKLVEMLGISSRTSPTITKQQHQMKRQSFWHLFETKCGFFELFCFTFVLLNSTWTELNATEMQFNQVLEATQRRLKPMLFQSRICTQELLTIDMIYMQMNSKRAAAWLHEECYASAVVSVNVYIPWTKEEITLLRAVNANSAEKVHNLEQRALWTITRKVPLIDIPELEQNAKADGDYEKDGISSPLSPLGTPPSEWSESPVRRRSFRLPNLLMKENRTPDKRRSSTTSVLRLTSSFCSSKWGKAKSALI